ncbi:MAG: NirD/YgiW/YdeI family stress tolerance protein [Sutterellaceae bacterium]|nr:NirD/YgiW/YdeI family stress tolerance protein [Sutterellaceae bacterium]
MKAIQKFAALASMTAVFGAGIAQAQFVNNAPNSIWTVQQMKDTARDDQMVVLEGYLVNQVKHDKYTFQDTTGTVLVEIDDRIFAGQRVDSKTKIRIEGEFEKDFMDPDEVDVYRLTIIR